jgi:hypothetical protein
MIGAVNLSTGVATSNLVVKEVQCPDGAASPLQSNQPEGVVYCTPGPENDNSSDREVTFKVLNPSSVEYGVFVQPLTTTVPVKILPGDKNIIGTLPPNGVKVYAYPEQPTATVESNARLLLQTRGTDVRVIGRLYADNLTSNQQGVNRCSATIWWENKADPQPFPTSQASCVINNGDSIPNNTNYLVVINAGNNCIKYRTRLVPGTNAITRQPDTLSDCSN